MPDFEIQDLAWVNASINAVVTLLLLIGRVLIAKKMEDAHRKVMSSALVLSAIFLVLYVTRYIAAGGNTKISEEVEPIWRISYLVMLASHVILAIVIVPLVLRGVLFAIRGQRERHRRIMRYTWPMWIYVTSTGVLVYFCAHVWLQ